MGSTELGVIAIQTAYSKDTRILILHIQTQTHGLDIIYPDPRFCTALSRS